MQQTRKIVILCVDDEANPLTLRKLILEREGYEVVTASSALEALNLILSRPVDLVLSDLLMPVTTGAELARQIKDVNPQLPVVIISGVNEMPEDANAADLFMSKLEGPQAMCLNISAVLARQPSASKTRLPGSSDLT